MTQWLFQVMKVIGPSLFAIIRRYWFLAALFAICLVTLADRFHILADTGRWLKNHHGPNFVISAIFLFSGFLLSIERLKDGLMDMPGMLMAFAVTFIAAPLTAALICLIPMDTGIIVGLFLVAAMPSTLSSGVVMTAAAGGNAAHALLTTIVSNCLAVLTIPYALSILLNIIGQATTVTFDKAAIMLKIVLIVVVPLIAGMLLRYCLPFLYNPLRAKLVLANQLLVLFMIWTAMSQTRDILIHSGTTVIKVLLVVFTFHCLLLMSAWLLIRIGKRGKGRRESILFIGSQKTLPLSVILQMTLFPHYTIIPLVYVLHHIVHLMMDAYLVEYLKTR